MQSMKKRNNQSLPGIAAAVILGLVLGVMAAFMSMGVGTSLNDFLKAGAVYDFLDNQLQKSTPKWQYDSENGYFAITGKNATKKFKMFGSKYRWNYLYVTVGKMNVESQFLELRYYDKKTNQIGMQEICFRQGENVIQLNAELEAYKFGFVLPEAEGVCFSLDSMQLREKLPAYSKTKFFIVFGSVFVVVTAGSILFFYKTEKRDTVKIPGELLGYIYENMAGIGRSRQKKWKKKDCSVIRRILFGSLILLGIFSDVLEWDQNDTGYRYPLLIAAVLLVLAGIFCREKAQKHVKWQSALACSWYGIWTIMIISDFFAGNRRHFLGYVMIFAAGFFIYMWSRMADPKQIWKELWETLEIIFVMSVIYCLFFRPKLLAVQYNGIFNNAEKSAMFALLMVILFFSQLELFARAEYRGGRVYFVVTELALAVYLVLRAESPVGYAALAVITALFLGRIIVNRHPWNKWIRSLKLQAVLAILCAGVIAGGFHMGIKVVPQTLGTACAYENEQKTTRETDEILNSLAQYDPAALEGVTKEADIPKNVIWKNALRHLNLFGNQKMLNVYWEKTQIYNAYIDMAYRYGILILVPFLLYLCCIIFIGVSSFSGKERTHTFSFWMFGVCIIFLLFSVGGNIWDYVTHPLWICMFLGTGYWFTSTE